MTLYGGERSIFEEQHMIERSVQIRQMLVKAPLAPLESLAKEWGEKSISPNAVVTALGHIAGRTLNSNETRNAKLWITDETDQYQEGQGEL